LGGWSRRPGVATGPGAAVGCWGHKEEATNESIEQTIAVFPILADPDKNNLQSAQLLIG